MRPSCVSVLIALSLAVGCRNPQHTAGDPLVGPVNPPMINGQPSPPPTTPVKAQNDVRATPTSQSGNTTAGLVNNTQLPGGRPLTIGDSAAPNFQLTNTSKESPGKTPTVLPVPRDVPPTHGVTPSSWTTSDHSPVMGDALAALKARGAVGEHQETAPEGIRFTCFVPSRTNPNNLRQYEVTAPDLQSAAQAVLRQLDANPSER